MLKIREKNSLPSLFLDQLLQKFCKLFLCLFEIYIVVESLNHVGLFATPWTAACLASLSYTVSWSWLRFMSIEWCYLTISSSAAPVSSCPQCFPASGSFPINWLLASAGQSIGASTSASVLPMNIQGWIPLRLTGLISSLSKGLSSLLHHHNSCKIF